MLLQKRRSATARGAGGNGPGLLNSKQVIPVSSKEQTLPPKHKQPNNTGVLNLGPSKRDGLLRVREQEDVTSELSLSRDT